MEWTRVLLPGEVDLVGVALWDDGTLIAATATGEVVTIDLSSATASAIWGSVPHTTALVGCGTGSAAMVTSGGGFASLRSVGLETEVVDRDVELSAVACDGAGRVRVVGGCDERTGVAFERPLGESAAWRRVRLEPGTPALLAVSGRSEPFGIVAGYRGYVALWREEGLVSLPPSTQHPLRAVTVMHDGRWFVGGGGWAADMAILLEGEGDRARPVLSARGDRVIVGLASDEARCLWLAENRTDGRRWEGVVVRLDQSRVEVVEARFQDQLRGIMIVSGMLVVYGKSGLLAWRDVVG